jgi:hypothetical protein
MVNDLWKSRGTGVNTRQWPGSGLLGTLGRFTAHYKTAAISRDGNPPRPQYRKVSNGANNLILIQCADFIAIRRVKNVK